MTNIGSRSIRCRDMLDACDMTALLDMRLIREMGRANNLECGFKD